MTENANADVQKRLARGLFFGVLSAVFAIVNVVWTFFSDIVLGWFSVERLPGGGQYLHAWATGSPAGLVLTLLPHGSVFMFALPFLAGLAASLLCRNLLLQRRPVFGARKWVLAALMLLWLLKFPVPVQYSLIYAATVAY